jgi:hypothetical protein
MMGQGGGQRGMMRGPGGAAPKKPEAKPEGEAKP